MLKETPFPLGVVGECDRRGSFPTRERKHTKVLYGSGYLGHVPDPGIEQRWSLLSPQGTNRGEGWIRAIFRWKEGEGVNRTRKQPTRVEGERRGQNHISTRFQTQLQGYRSSG